MKPVELLPSSTMRPGLVPAAPEPNSAEISSTAGWAKHHTRLVSQTTLPPSITDFTPLLSGPPHHQLCPGGTLSCRSLPTCDSPELGLLDLVAARNVLEDLVQLQGSRGTFTVYPSLNRMCSVSRCCCHHTQEPPEHPRPSSLTLPHQVSSQDMARSCKLKPIRTFRSHAPK